MNPTPATTRVPDEIARIVILPEYYRDEKAIHAAYEWLRENQPVGLAEVEGWDPVWLIARHEDVTAIERTPDAFEIGDFNQILRNQASDRFQRDVLGKGSICVLPTLSTMDPPDHTKYRALLMQWFMPDSIRVFQEQIRRDAKDAVDGLMERGGQCDFARDFAMLYPLRVIMTLLGVPREDEPLMLKLTQDFFGTREPDVKPAAPAADPAAMAKQWHAGVAGFFDYFEQLAAERRKRPTNDFLSLLVNAKVDGEPMDATHRNAFCVSIAAAGHDTTASSVAGGMHGLITHPKEFAAVKTDLSLVSGLVDESMRWASPVKHFMRSTRREATVGGQQIAKDQRLMLLYGSANRDAAVFDDPYTFRITRRPNRHLAMGAGHHACVGQHVAKMEMRTLWEELLPRLCTVELAEEPVFIASNWVGGLKKLPVRFTAA